MTATVMAWWRFGLESLVLLPCARKLPRRAAHFVAAALGLADVVTGVGRLARRELSASHGVSGPSLWMAAWRKCSLPYIDLVYLTRSMNGNADDPRRSGSHVVLSQAIKDHVSAGRALVVVVGHFPFSTSLAAAAHVRKLRATLGPIDAAPAIAIAATRPYARMTAGARRERLRSQTVQACAKSVFGESAELVWENGSRNAEMGFRLFRAARQPGFLCLITLDAPWDSARSIREPFAGWTSFPISTNVARLATAASAGVTLALPRRRGRDEYTVALGEVYLPEEFASAEEMTDFLARQLERHIGYNPTEYLLSVGTDRRWDALAGGWVSTNGRPESGESAQVGSIHPQFEVTRGAME